MAASIPAASNPARGAATVLVLHPVADMTDFLSILSQFPLLLLLLAPDVGLAGQEASATPAAAFSGLPGTEERAPLRLREDDRAGEEAASRPPRGLRILAETGAGVLTSLGGGFDGFLAGGALCQAGVVGSNQGVASCVYPAAIGLLLGTGAGFALGTWWGGEEAGGDGKLLGAMGGFGVGAVSGVKEGLTRH